MDQFNHQHWCAKNMDETTVKYSYCHMLIKDFINTNVIIGTIKIKSYSQ